MAGRADWPGGLPSQPRTTGQPRALSPPEVKNNWNYVRADDPII